MRGLGNRHEHAWGLRCEHSEACDLETKWVRFVWVGSGLRRFEWDACFDEDQLRAVVYAAATAWQAASAELDSEHAIGRAIVARARADKVGYEHCSKFVASSGSGLKCVLGGSNVLIGNRKWLQSNQVRT